MKNLVLLIILFAPFCLSAQKDIAKIVAENNEFRKTMNSEYADSVTSPLTEKDLKIFKQLPFFEIDSTFYIVAEFVKAKKSKPFKMKTTTDREPVYSVYGVASFILKGKKYKLNIYQNHGLMAKEEYKDYLFLPFTDLTNSEETYGGGRFMDLSIPKGDTIVIDFNKAYNPYCAYNYKYSCPIPPSENFIDTKIMAGVIYEQRDH